MNTIIDKSIIYSKHFTTKKKSERESIKNKKARMYGEEYVGRKKDEHGSMMKTAKAKRQMKERCSSKKCSKLGCKKFSEEDREKAFTKFWKLNWDEKTKFVAKMTKKSKYEKETGEISR
jgi:hypothetical protein